ncbi:MAG: prepilin peptidase [Rubrobacteraceae bacterium]|uniref:prepilin peptidase n=1 Tax=Rubrobacter naiadicus TaxID=1392641 RepID=UPI002361436E|nr:A24 family peptidase [Rubrobacter naiadicus]MBX6764102.1 prepilin peptidase [Rubrobacteraceae bacterium]MCL6438123.1 prepilin peptidase [Rubrobacteraceae bacterium]
MSLALLAALFGLLIGSFLNVAIYRIPRGLSVVWPPSHCPVCHEPIAPWDNVPLLSYLLLRGRCRNCKERIPPRYPAVELATALLFGAAAYAFGIGWGLARALFFLGALIVLAATDADRRILPNAVVLPATGAGLLLSAAADPARWWVYPLSTAGVGGALLAVALLYPGGMGMGDVKMGGMLGAFLGGYAALAVFFGALLGALVGVGLMLAGRAGRRSALPFGTFMSVGGMVVLFWGQEIWGAYLGVFSGG